MSSPSLQSDLEKQVDKIAKYIEDVRSSNDQIRFDFSYPEDFDSFLDLLRQLDDFVDLIDQCIEDKDFANAQENIEEANELVGSLALLKAVLCNSV